MKDLINTIERLADEYAVKLKEKTDRRIDEMKGDDKSHFLIYRVLGIPNKEGNLIDIYQNKGRFLYKYAGAFLEEVAIICFKFKYPDGGKIRIENTLGTRPKKFEIDFLNSNDAIEIKWRDATTDGDHITKEHTRIKVVDEHGYKPIRVMFYYPNRKQAIKIQETLKTLYAGINGEYYAGDDAWKYVKKYTGVDLKSIFENIADKKVKE